MEIYQPTIKDFEERYGKARSNINNRIAGLKAKGYDLEAQKDEGKNVYSAAQVQLMDRLDAHLQAGGTIATFPPANGNVDLSYGSQDKPQLSYRTQDSPPKPDPSLALVLALEAITNKLQTPQPVDPLANLKSLQEACDRGWLLSTSQLAALLGLKSLNGKEFSRYGFRFIRVGRNGAESAWRVGKETITSTVLQS